MLPADRARPTLLYLFLIHSGFGDINIFFLLDFEKFLFYFILFLLINLLVCSTPILATAFEASKNDRAISSQEVLAQYDLTKLETFKALIDSMKDVCSYDFCI